MQLARPVIAANPRQFGRGPFRWDHLVPAPARQVSADLKLFAMTFAAGFLFVSILIGRSVAGLVELPSQPRRHDAHGGNQQ